LHDYGGLIVLKSDGRRWQAGDLRKISVWVQRQSVGKPGRTDVIDTKSKVSLWEKSLLFKGDQLYVLLGLQLIEEISFTQSAPKSHWKSSSQKIQNNVWPSIWALMAQSSWYIELTIIVCNLWNWLFLRCIQVRCINNLFLLLSSVPWNECSTLYPFVFDGDLSCRQCFSVSNNAENPLHVNIHLFFSQITAVVGFIW
jgi:hypothetical protein